MRSEEGGEFLVSQVCLSEDRAKGASGELVMEGDDHGSAGRTQFHVATALADLIEAELGERLDGLPARNDRQGLAQALSSRVAMMGGSISVGSG